VTSTYWLRTLSPLCLSSAFLFFNGIQLSSTVRRTTTPSRLPLYFKKARPFQNELLHGATANAWHVCHDMCVLPNATLLSIKLSLHSVSKMSTNHEPSRVTSALYYLPSLWHTAVSPSPITRNPMPQVRNRYVPYRSSGSWARSASNDGHAQQWHGAASQNVVIFCWFRPERCKLSKSSQKAKRSPCSKARVECVHDFLQGATTASQARAS